MAADNCWAHDCREDEFTTVDLNFSVLESFKHDKEVIYLKALNVSLLL